MPFVRLAKVFYYVASCFAEEPFIYGIGRRILSTFSIDIGSFTSEPYIFLRTQATVSRFTFFQVWGLLRGQDAKCF